MTTVRVTLAEVPTDVLVWLCEQSERVSLSVFVIADAVAPDSTADVARALRLLLDAGYVEGEIVDRSYLFRASAAGRAAVAAASAVGADHPGCLDCRQQPDGSWLCKSSRPCPGGAR